MGTSFFRGGMQDPRLQGSPVYQEARALSAPITAGRAAGMGAQRDLGAAQAFGRAVNKPNRASGAYPPAKK
jgi:hypothetical protein